MDTLRYTGGGGDVAGGGCETQLQVSENLNKISWREMVDTK